MDSDSDKQPQYGEDIDRVRELFADGDSHLPKEANEISDYGYAHILALFRRGVLLRTREQLNYSHVEEYRGKAKWCRVRGYAYVLADSPLLGENNTLERRFERTERWTLVTTIEKQMLNFINYEQSKRLQKHHYKRQLSSKQIVKYFKERDLGATTRIIAKDLGIEAVKLSSLLQKMVARAELVRIGRWNPTLGRETVFRGKLQGYVYGLNNKQCKMFIQSGEVLTCEANAMLKKVIENSNEKRLIPLYTFTSPPYNYDPAVVSYHANSLVNTFKEIEKIESKGQVFLYVKDKMKKEDVKRGIEYWDRKLSKKKSFGNIIGDIHEKLVQIALDEMSEDLEFDWQFQRVIRGSKVSFQIRISTGHEIDRILLVTMNPLGVKHYFPIEAKYKRSGMMLPDVKKLYDVLRKSMKFGSSINFDGKQVRVLKANVTPVLVAPYFTKDARNWALRHGMIVLSTWVLTKYYAEKKGLKRIDPKKWAKEYIERTNKNTTIDDFLEVKLRRRCE